MGLADTMAEGAYDKEGNFVSLIDAKYKTIKYDLPLFFLCIRTNAGYSVVAQLSSCQKQFKGL